MHATGKRGAVKGGGGGDAGGWPPVGHRPPPGQGVGYRLKTPPHSYPPPPPSHRSPLPPRQLAGWRHGDVTARRGQGAPAWR